MSVQIIDYGMGNLRSITAAVSHLNRKVEVTGDPDYIARGQTLILPGVGSFPVAMRTMTETGIDEAIIQAASTGSCKILGICLGMQLLMARSEEGIGGRGLSIVDGTLERFPNELGLPVPHVGFNGVCPPRDSILFRGFPEETDFYFVHAYRAKLPLTDTVVATSHYGEDFVAAFERGNVYGTQFHPEKSQSNGLQLLENFLDVDIR